MTRRAHRYGNAAGSATLGCGESETNFKRFFDGNVVCQCLLQTVGDSADIECVTAGGHGVFAD